MDHPLDPLIHNCQPDGIILVYAAWTDQNQSSYKLGYSKELHTRKFNLALSNQHFRLWWSVPGSRELEALLKGRFWKDTIDYREIFRVSQDTFAYFIKLINAKGGKFS